MQKIHQIDLASYLLNRFHPSDKPNFLFIGANDGFSDDTQVNGLDFIHPFLLNGPWWSGVLVEPIPSVFRRLQENYKNHKNNLTFFNIVVSKNHGVQFLNIYGRDGKASSLVYDEIQQSINTGHSMVDQEKFRLESNTPESGKIEVLSLTYNEILKICGLDCFDFIKVDAEGKDHEIVCDILETSKLNKKFPSCIYFENHKTDKTLLSELFNCKYMIFRTGLTQSGIFLDLVAIRRSFLSQGIFSPKFILD